MCGYSRSWVWHLVAWKYGRLRSWAPSLQMLKWGGNFRLGRTYSPQLTLAKVTKVAYLNLPSWGRSCHLPTWVNSSHLLTWSIHSHLSIWDRSSHLPTWDNSSHLPTWSIHSHLFNWDLSSHLPTWGTPSHLPTWGILSHLPISGSNVAVEVIHLNSPNSTYQA